MNKAIKKTSSGIAFMVLCLSFAFGSGEESYYAKSYSRLSFVKGDVYVQRAGDLGFEEGVVNLLIVEGDKLGTREGRAEINLGNNNFLRLDADSQVDMETLPKNGNDLISIHLLSGRAYFRINNMAMEKEIELHTPDVSFYFLQEGLYRIDVTENKETVMLALEGEVEAAGEEGSRVVSRGSLLRASEGYFLAESGSYSESADSEISGESFVDWNRSRDSFYGRSVGRSYLPAELYEYEAELDYYGRWVNEPSFGYVWVPRVSYSSWRPYYNGRWVWYPIIGWNWVSYDPWGWCVSHYGRWHWGSGMGWYWIPTRSWGPAWVHWYHGYNYVGWSPMSYWGQPGIIVNNRYYGRGYRGNYPYNSRALTVVHRNQLQARRISSVSLSQANVGKLGRLSLTSNQPQVRYVANRDRALTMRASNALSRSNVRSVNKSAIISRGQRSSARVEGKSSSRAVNSGSIRSGTVRSGKTPARASTTISSSTVRKYGTRSSETSTSARAIRRPAASTSGRRATTVKQYAGESRSSKTSPANNSSARTARRPSSLTDRIIKKYEPGTNRSSTSSKSAGNSSKSSSAVKKRSSNSSSSARSAAGSRNVTTPRKYSSNSAVSRKSGSSQGSRSSARTPPRTTKRPSSSAVSSSRTRVSSGLSQRTASSRSIGIPSRSSSARNYSVPNRSSSSRSSAAVRSRPSSTSSLSRTPRRSTSSRSVSRPKSSSVKSRASSSKQSKSSTSRSRSSSSRARKK